MKYLQAIYLSFLLVVSYGQNLIVNPGAELDPVTNGWISVSGNWVSGSERPAQAGSFHFYAGNELGTVELYQDVSVVAYAVAIDGGTQPFYFEGYIRTYNNGNDAGRIIVEYRDASSAVLSTYDTGEYTVSSWNQYVDTRTAPVGTRTIRIRLISRWLTGGDNDGYMDNLQLVQGSFGLPVELLNFDVKVETNGQIQTSWSTASEINNDYFTIEKSQDGINWIGVGEVEGAGNASIELNYSFSDVTPFNGVSFYRLKQTDFDGTYTYSKVEKVETKLNVTKVIIYPNPSSNQITIEGSEQELKQVRIYNLYGQDITYLTRVIDRNETQVSLDLTKLNQGSYFVRFGTMTKEIVKR